VRRTLEAGEFQRRREIRPLSLEHSEEIDRFQERWGWQRSPIIASEFVGAALVAGDPDRAADAAAFLAQDGPTPALRSLGRRALEPSVDAGLDTPGEVSSTERHVNRFHVRLHAQKSLLARDPRNALGWSNLARWYTAMGQFEKAEQAMTVALALAPASRYMMRSAARFFVQLRQPERAYRLLLASPRLQEGLPPSRLTRWVGGS